jgi:hypothetical protein
MNDNELSTMVRESVTGVHSATPIAQIISRGRAVRARRQIPGFAACLAVVAGTATALALGMTGVHRPSQAKAPGTIRTTSFTLVSHYNGTATLTINPDVLLDVTALQNDLRQDGIPALVTSGSFCSSDPAPAGFWQVVGGSTDPKNMPKGQVDFGPENPPTITFNPAAIPAGTELSFGDLQPSISGRRMQEAAMGLIDANSYTCTSTEAEVAEESPFGFIWPAGQS